MELDAALHQGLAQGDVDSCRRYYRARANGLFRYLLGMLPDGSAVEDVLQDAFLSLFSAVREREVLHLDAYLYQTARRRAINWLRDERREQERRHRQAADMRVEQVTTPLAALLAGEETLRLYDALRQLPEEQREVVLLYCWSDMTFDAIGSLLEIP